MNAAKVRGSGKAVAQLVRLPNVFTAAADSLAGWLVAGASVGGGASAGLVDPARWWPLPLVSIR